MSQRNFRQSTRQSHSRRPHQRSSNGRQPKKAYIHPSRFVQTAKPQVQEDFIPVHQFSDFALHPLLQQNLAAIGYESPSPIQDLTIPEGLAGKDIVGIANTGTGKTAAFSLPVLQRLITDPQAKALILAPTRELALQIGDQARRLGLGSRIRSAMLIGGTSMGPQLRDLRNNPRLVIGTPGRIKDHLERRTLFLGDCNLLVIDEVDRMLDMGFVNDIRTIISNTNQTKQSFYFSATMDTRVADIIESFSFEPVHISVKSGETSDNVEQNVVAYSSIDNKIEKLHEVLTQSHVQKTIIFDDTHRSVDRLSKELATRGFSTDSIHGGKSQSQRKRVLDRFKRSEINVLVATDVAARGLDVSDITHVINFSLPNSYDDYVHRIGRTGRAGKVGHALTFIEK